MNNLVHVSFVFGGIPKILDLEPVFSRLGDWVRFSGTGWILSTDAEIKEIFFALSSVVDPQDKFVASVVEPYQLAARLDPWIWDWITSKAPAGTFVQNADIHFPPYVQPPMLGKK